MGWRMLALIVVTITLALGLIWTYVWVFEQAGCQARSDVPCMLNNNSGVLQAGAAIGAGVGFWIVFLAREDELRRHRTSLERQRSAILGRGIREAYSNLVALASCLDRGELRRWPILSIDRARAVCSASGELTISNRYVEHYELLVRRFDDFEDQRLRFPYPDRDPKIGVPVKIADEDIGKPIGRIVESYTLSGNPSESAVASELHVRNHHHVHVVPLFVVQCMRVLLDGMLHEKFEGLIDELGNQELISLRRRLRELSAPGSEDEVVYWLAYRSSSRSIADGEIRESKRPLICWVADGNPTGVEAVEFESIVGQRVDPGRCVH